MVIAAYAARRNLDIVRTYADEGRSGLSIQGRDALQQMIHDVQTRQADFGVILVYDVSRWGRFQDADESAYYEFMCKKAGVKVEYCAEEFQNDGSPMATVWKHMKRAVAGEYSRDLSTKVFIGQCNLVRHGFWQGAQPGFGLRRALISANGSPKGILAFGERKNIQSDRIILVPGPAYEVETVRRIYRAFVTERKSTLEIARELNLEGIINSIKRPWSSTSIRNILTNEKYAGTNVFNRVSRKLKGKYTRNEPSAWIRTEHAFEGIVEPTVFAAARQINEWHCEGMSDDEMLRLLGVLFREKGCLTSKIINDAHGLPHSDFYRRRFGTLAQAYELVGYHLSVNYDYVEIKRSLAGKFAGIIAEVIAEIERVGLSADFDKATKAFVINAELTLAVFVVRCRHCRNRSPEWLIQSRRGFRSEQIVAVRMDQANQKPMDYFLLPTKQVHRNKINVGTAPIHAYRFQSLAVLVQAIGRVLAAKSRD